MQTPRSRAAPDLPVSHGGTPTTAIEGQQPDLVPLVKRKVVLVAGRRVVSAAGLVAAVPPAESAEITPQRRYRPVRHSHSVAIARCRQFDSRRDHRDLTLSPPARQRMSRPHRGPEPPSCPTSSSVARSRPLRPLRRRSCPACPTPDRKPASGRRRGAVERDSNDRVRVRRSGRVGRRRRRDGGPR